MKISNLFLASTALPLMLLTANASPLPTQASNSIPVAQAEPAEPGQLPPRARPGQGGDDDSRPQRRQGRPGANEEGGPRGQRGGGGQDGAREAPRAPRATSPEDGSAAPRPSREQRPPAERPATPEAPSEAPSKPSPAPTERAQPPADSPARPQRPSTQEREQAPRERPPAERPRPQQTPDTPARPAGPAPSPTAPPAATQEQRPSPGAPRPAETGRPGRDDRRTPDQQRTPPAPPAATEPPAPSRPAPPAPAAPQTQPGTLPAPTPPALAAPQTRPGAAAPTAPQAAPGTAQPLDPARVRIDDLRNQRRERREGDRVIIEEPGNRTIIRQGNDVIIRHDESERFRRIYGADDVRVERRGNNEQVTIVRRPDGSEIVSVRDDDGNLIRRIRREPAGREVVLIENRRSGIGVRPGYGYVEEEVLRLPPPTVRIPREEYIVETERASEADIVRAFTAPPVERIERAYTLDEVRRSEPLRERMRRVDVDTINFDFGSWELPRDQVNSLGAIAEGLRQAISRNPNEIFLVEGHTDAVGSNEDNLTLSDRRAETVATILSQQFQIPAENLTTQGYGEEYLKVNTQGPEQANRRVTLRRITPLLQGQNQQ